MSATPPTHANTKRQTSAAGDWERWLAVLLRSLHLVAVVWVGAFVVAAAAPQREASLLLLASGAVMLAMDLRAGRLALREVAGAFVVLKLLLVVWMLLDSASSAWIFWLLVVGSAVSSHAPKNFRHWPTAKS